MRGSGWEHDRSARANLWNRRNRLTMGENRKVPQNGPPSTCSPVGFRRPANGTRGGDLSSDEPGRLTGVNFQRRRGPAKVAGDSGECCAKGEMDLERRHKRVKRRT